MQCEFVFVHAQCNETNKKKKKKKGDKATSQTLDANMNFKVKAHTISLCLKTN